MVAGISPNANAKLAYEELQSFARLNSQYFEVLSLRGNIVTFLFKSPVSDRDGWFLSYPNGQWVHLAKIQLEYISNRRVPKIKFLDPIPFHPNILERDFELNNPWILSRSNYRVETSASQLVGFIWGLLTYQIIDDRYVQNVKAQEWCQKHRSSLPITNVALQIPSMTSGFNITGRSKPSENTLPAQESRTISTSEKKETEFKIKDNQTGNPNLSVSNSEPSKSEHNISPIPPLVSGTATPGFTVKKVLKYEPRQKPLPTDIHSKTQAWHQPVVILPQSVWNKILMHGSSDKQNEQFGILIGAAYINPTNGGVWLDIVEMIPAVRHQKTRSSLQVSAEEMSEMVRMSESVLSTHPNACRLGWYHTHPGHTIFMSGTDKSNHRDVYRTEWQIALVYDPINHLYGFFSGLECKELPEANIVLIPDVAPLSNIKMPVYQHRKTTWENVPQPRPFQPPIAPYEQNSPAVPNVSRLPSVSYGSVRNDSYEQTINDSGYIPDSQPPKTGENGQQKSYWRRIYVGAIYVIIFAVGAVIGFFFRGDFTNTSQTSDPINRVTVVERTVIVNKGDPKIAELQAEILNSLRSTAVRKDLDEPTRQHLLGQLEIVFQMDEHSDNGREAGHLIDLLKNRTFLTEQTQVSPTLAPTKTLKKTITPLPTGTYTPSMTPTAIFTMTPTITVQTDETPVHPGQ